MTNPITQKNDRRPIDARLRLEHGSGHELLYRINEKDEIVFVNDEWDHFASTNSGECVASANVLHKPLWNFIKDHTTRHLYRQILHFARGGHPFRFSLRCDAPTCRRLIEMAVSPAKEGCVDFHTRILSQEECEPIALLDSTAPRSNEMLTICSWCTKIKTPSGWIELPQALAEQRLLERTPLPRLSHGICEKCYQELIQKLESESEPVKE